MILLAGFLAPDKPRGLYALGVSGQLKKLTDPIGNAESGNVFPARRVQHDMSAFDAALLCQGIPLADPVMKTLLASALAALAVLAGCTSTPTRTVNQIDIQYEYGIFAGLPQRPSPMN